MYAVNENRSLFFLIDDDPHSARFFIGKLKQQIDVGMIDLDCDWFQGADAGLKAINQLRGNGNHQLPKLIIIDLKSSSLANEEFVRRIEPITRDIGVPVVVMVGRLEEESCNNLYDAGASRVFERRANRGEFIEEVSKIINYSVSLRNTQRIEA